MNDEPKTLVHYVLMIYLNGEVLERLEADLPFLDISVGDILCANVWNSSYPEYVKVVQKEHSIRTDVDGLVHWICVHTAAERSSKVIRKK